MTQEYITRTKRPRQRFIAAPKKFDLLSFLPNEIVLEIIQAIYTWYAPATGDPIAVIADQFYKDLKNLALVFPALAPLIDSQICYVVAHFTIPKDITPNRDPTIFKTLFNAKFLRDFHIDNGPSLVQTGVNLAYDQLKMDEVLMRDNVFEVELNTPDFNSPTWGVTICIMWNLYEAVTGSKQDMCQFLRDHDSTHENVPRVLHNMLSNMISEKYKMALFVSDFDRHNFSIRYPDQELVVPNHIFSKRMGGLCWTHRMSVYSTL